MSGERVDITNMMWQPKLIRLTLIANPDIDGGEPTPTFVNPQQISGIRRTASCYAKVSSYGKPADQVEYHPRIACTEVHCCHFTVLVTETPDEVAKLRDEAFGHEPPKPVLKAVP